MAEKIMHAVTDVHKFESKSSLCDLGQIGLSIDSRHLAFSLEVSKLRDYDSNGAPINRQFFKRPLTIDERAWSGPNRHVIRTYVSDQKTLKLFFNASFDSISRMTRGYKSSM